MIYSPILSFLDIYYIYNINKPNLVTKKVIFVNIEMSSIRLLYQNFYTVLKFHTPKYIHYNYRIKIFYIPNFIRYGNIALPKYFPSIFSIFKKKIHIQILIFSKYSLFPSVCILSLEYNTLSPSLYHCCAPMPATLPPATLSLYAICPHFKIKP